MKRISGLLIAAGTLFGQTAGPSFEVVSVKSVTIQPGQRPAIPACTGGLYRASGWGVATSIRFAYNLQTYQLTGMPDWTRKNDAAYDIEAKAAGPVNEAECRQMVQSLLGDRFKLTIHRETKPFSLMALVIGPNGSKLTKKTDTDEGNVVFVNGTPGYSGEKGWTMAQLAEYAQRNYPGSIVVDRTGLEGFYRIKLDYEIQAGVPPGEVFEAAIERQLGLKLENRKEPTEMVVVDRLERPAAN